MHDALSRNLYFIREKVGALKAVNEYDIMDPESQTPLLKSTEEIGLLTKLFRFSDYKILTPFNVILLDLDGNQVLRVQRGATFLRSRVTVFDENDQPVGMFIQKLFTIGGAFRLLDMEENELGHLKGKWSSWEFSFRSPQDAELARVTKKWAGIGKELFTSADNYMLEIEDVVPADNPLRYLIMAAVLCIDMVLKE